MTFESWLAFCAIAFIAAVTPGPAVMLVAVHSISFGFKSSLLTALGNACGLLIMSCLSVIGLSALVLHSAVAFSVIKILGAVYLVYMGINLWRKGLVQKVTYHKEPAKKNHFGLYIQGILVAITNPKAIIFTTALFPQFISVSEPLLPQFLLLILTFMSLSFICLTGYSLLAQRAGNGAKFKVSEKLMGKVFGSSFIGAGCLLAASSK